MKSQLLCQLPEQWVSTPDGMVLGKEGELILSCPNFANPSLPSCVLRIFPDGKIEKWFDVPLDEDSQNARSMGIARDEEYLYLCDNQGWSGQTEFEDKGRILKLKVSESGQILENTVIAKGMRHPNGLVCLGDYFFVTQSVQKDQNLDSAFKSGLYRFHKLDQNIQILNTDTDENLVATFATENPEIQYGLDGIAVSPENALFVGNFGDAVIYKINLDQDFNYIGWEIFAQDKGQLQSIDGICFDENGILFVADFDKNAIIKVDKEGKISKLAQTPYDNDGADGQINQPAEVRCWGDKLVISNFDLVTGPTKINSSHHLKQNLSYIQL